MKPRFPFLTVGLSIALLAIACAPAAPTESPAEPVPAVAQPTATVAAVPATEASVAATATAVPVVQPIATSRGPNLEAVDPATVSLASGGLQLVEFFRFT